MPGRDDCAATWRACCACAVHARRSAGMVCLAPDFGTVDPSHPCTRSYAMLPESQDGVHQGGDLAVQHIHTFLVHPGKGRQDKTEINGTTVPLSGPMFNLLDSIYSRSDQECDIDITFRPTREGKQQNDCRDLLIGYLSNPALGAAKTIAERLSDTTDGRSGLGLLFLIAVKESANHKIVISRFPTDSAIYVDGQARSLTVEFLERVFMKNKASYKAVMYENSSLRGGFWSGRAVDKQLNYPGGQLSDY